MQPVPRRREEGDWKSIGNRTAWAASVDHMRSTRRGVAVARQAQQPRIDLLRVHLSGPGGRRQRLSVLLLLSRVRRQISKSQTQQQDDRTRDLPRPQTIRQAKPKANAELRHARLSAAVCGAVQPVHAVRCGSRWPGMFGGAGLSPHVPQETADCGNTESAESTTRRRFLARQCELHSCYRIAAHW